MKIKLTLVLFISIITGPTAFSANCLDTYAEIFPVSCGPYTSPSGEEVWFEFGTYLDTIPNIAGCDSIITIYLNAINLEMTINQQGNSIVVQQEGGNYQWLDCDNGFIPIPGETNQGFAPDTTGNYAVIVEESGCMDTSACFSYVMTAAVDIKRNNQFSIYPNPAKNKFYLDLHQSYFNVNVVIHDEMGREVFSKYFSEAKLIPIELNLSSGIYFTSIIVDDKITLKLVIQ